MLTIVLKIILESDPILPFSHIYILKLSLLNTHFSHIIGQQHWWWWHPLSTVASSAGLLTLPGLTKSIVTSPWTWNWEIYSNDALIIMYRHVSEQVWIFNQTRPPSFFHDKEDKISLAMQDYHLAMYACRYHCETIFFVRFIACFLSWKFIRIP